MMASATTDVTDTATLQAMDHRWRAEKLWSRVAVAFISSPPARFDHPDSKEQEHGGQAQVEDHVSCVHHSANKVLHLIDHRELPEQRRLPAGRVGHRRRRET